MPHDPLVIANQFLELARTDGRTLDAMKLLRLVYIANGWCHALYEEPLIGEPILALDYGPSIPSLDEAFAPFGNRVIQDLSRQDLQEATGVLHADRPVLDLLQRVWEEYGRFSGVELANLTHGDNSPWRTTRDHRSPREAAPVIAEGLIALHYRYLARLNRVAS